MDKTLYVSDLDGTLLTPREDLSPFTIRVLNRLVEQGMAFTYATARSQHSADVVTRGLTKSLPVIIYNGAFIRRGERRETLLRQLLPGPSVARARQVFGEAGISPLVYTMAQGGGAGAVAAGKGEPRGGPVCGLPPAGRAAAARGR